METKATDKKSKKLSLKERAEMLIGKHRYDVCKKYGLPAKGWHYHWANIDGGNVEFYEEMGYSKCLDSTGCEIRNTGRSLGMTQILMRMPIEEYEEIQKHKLNEDRQRECEMGKKNIPGLDASHMYGTVRIEQETSNKNL